MLSVVSICLQLERCVRSRNYLRRGEPPFHPKRTRSGHYLLQGHTVYGGVPVSAHLVHARGARRLHRTLRGVGASARICHFRRATHPHRHGFGQLFHAPRVVPEGTRCLTHASAVGRHQYECKPKHRCYSGTGTLSQKHPLTLLGPQSRFGYKLPII